MTIKRVTFAVKAPNWLGDSVLAIPAVKAVCECSRRGKLIVLASRTSGEVMRRIPNTLVFPFRQPGGSIANSIASIVKGTQVLRRFKPVIILSFTRSATSALTCFLGGVPRRVGFDGSALRFLYTDRVRDVPGRHHLITSYSRLPQSIGISVNEAVPSLEPLPGDIEAAIRLLASFDLKKGSYFCIFPGASYGPAKRWPPQRFALLASMLADKFDATPVVLGGEGDRPVCEEVMSRMRGRGLNLCGRIEIGTLIGLLRFAIGAVANDSGGMHLAAAIGIPVVGLFFSSDPSWTGPVSPSARYIYKSFECSPCFRRDCERNNACTQTISVEEVCETFSDLVSRT